MAIWSGVFPGSHNKNDRRRQGRYRGSTKSSIARLIDNGVSGLIVLPMLGENASLSMAERESVIRAAVAVSAGTCAGLVGPG